jgi:acyl-CoA thioester hydrolase
MGVTYYANYLVWFEVGRTDWLRHHGWTYREMERDGIRLPVIEAFCRYLAPARYDDELEVHTRATLVTPARVRFDYEIRVGSSGTTAAIGYTTHAALGTSGKPCRLPDRIRLVMPPARRPHGRASGGALGRPCNAAGVVARDSRPHGHATKGALGRPCNAAGVVARDSRPHGHATKRAMGRPCNAAGVAAEDTVPPTRPRGPDQRLQ